MHAQDIPSVVCYKISYYKNGNLSRPEGKFRKLHPPVRDRICSANHHKLSCLTVDIIESFEENIDRQRKWK